MTPDDDEGGEEEAAAGDGEQEDGVAEGSLGGGRGGGGVVAALGAALGTGGQAEGEQEKGEGERARQGDHWKKASRQKRKIQKMPMECQYQAAQSTRIWRCSIWREV